MSQAICSSNLTARELRDGLKNLYSVLKDAAPHLAFVLLTGVSKFSKVSLFSGLNNPNDTIAALGVSVTVEDASHHGRVDMTMEAFGHLYLFEFKVVEPLSDGSALAQLKAKGYADRYRGQGKPIHLVGVELSREQRQIVAFEVEALKP